VDLNKKSVKQQGGAMIPEQPGMQMQPQVDPQVMQITELFNTSIQEGSKPHDVVISLIEQQVDQNVIGQALMQLGMEQEAIVQLFQEVQEMQQPQAPTAQQINNNPQQISRAEEIQEEAPAMDMNITSMGQAKSGIEIKPENKGKFTRWAKARGMSVSEAANKVMSNKDQYPPSVVKMANFAKNAAGWKKEEGGETAYLANRDRVIKREMAKAESENMKEGGEFKPHFMYKGPRKIRAKDMATHLRLKERGYTHDAPKAQTGGNTDNLVKGINNLEDEGILSPGPMYINPAIFNNNKFNLGKAANVVLEGYENMFSGSDENKDGVKDGSFRDIPGKFTQAKIDKYANAAYDVKLDTSDENKNAAKDWFTQFQIENPTAEGAANKLTDVAEKTTTDLIEKSNVEPVISEKLLEAAKNGSQQVKDYINSILKKKGQSLPEETDVDTKVDDFNNSFYKDAMSVMETSSGVSTEATPDFTEIGKLMLRNGGSLHKAQFAGESGGPKDTLTFKEWVMQDPITRSTASAQQDYQAYVDAESADGGLSNVLPGDPPTADDLFQKINMPEVSLNNTGGVSGFIDRTVNSPVAKMFGDVSDFAVKGADVLNDYFDEVNKDKAQDELRGSLVADNIYGTKTDAFNKRGTFDINSGIMGSEGDATTGLYMNAKFGGGVNNAGFKALPPKAQHNILSNMAYGGDTKSQIVNVDSRMLAKLISAGANIEKL
tara:strand:- start:4488 stop:6641 length:2154 start_codon:yes stop_codon:yes gene_type:complete